MSAGPTSNYYRGSHIADVPNGPGIYAWYYKPRRPDWPTISTQLTSLLDSHVQIETNASLRYGMQLRSSAPGKVYYQSERRELRDTINDLPAAERKMVVQFLTDETFLTFSRPLYIGIAKSLNKRVFDQHYTNLTGYWDDNSEVNRYMQSYPDASVEQLTAALQLKRSFALEARARGLAAGDLIVYAYPTSEFVGAIAEDGEPDDEGMRRSLERVLHLLADPICGRR